MDKNKQVVSLDVFNALKSKYLSLNKKQTCCLLALKKAEAHLKDC